ncbi:MAG: type II toxin-antitoxin system RelE family toxin [Bacillota bacterium]
MNVRLEMTRPALKDLARLDRTTRERIVAALERLTQHPEAVNLKKLEGTADIWRYRVGDWRVILRFDREKGLLYVLHVKHRREAYRG